MRAAYWGCVTLKQSERAYAGKRKDADFIIEAMPAITI
jgi:hypothetical protein